MSGGLIPQIQPNIAGNFLSSLRDAQNSQQQQQAFAAREQAAQSQEARAQHQQQQADTTFDQGQHDHIISLLGPLALAVKPGDNAGFDRFKQAAAQLGADPQFLSTLTMDHLPALQQEFSASAPGRAMTNEDRQGRLTNAQITNLEAEAAKNRAMAANGGTARAPSGYTWGPAGNLVAIPGGPADPQVKPMNDDQLKALGFANRLEGANRILGGTDATNAETSYGANAAAGVPVVGNWLSGENYQQADQATRDFINAQLRRESGAAIGTSEFENAYRQYIPRPGDSKAVLAQKATARTKAFENMMLSTGGPRGQVMQNNAANNPAAGGPLGPAASPAGGGEPVALPPRGQEPQRGQLYTTSRGPAVYLGNGQFKAAQ